MSISDLLEGIATGADVGNYVAGNWRPAAGAVMEVRDPANPMVTVGRVPDSSAEDAATAVEAAEAAFEDWAALPAPRRGDILRACAEVLRDHTEPLAELMTREVGKPLAESRGEIGRGLMELDYAVGESTRLEGRTFPSRDEPMVIFSRLVPRGVIAAITPWNFPFVAPLRKIAPALVAGNTVVLKPAEQSPLTALALVALLTEAGLPKGVVNVVCGEGPTAGAALVSHPKVAGISFTGSTAVGRSIGEEAGRRLVEVQLELGGKNAAYVHSAAGLEQVVADITSTATQASGQRCTAISRVLVDDRIADELVGLLAKAFDGLRLGSGFDTSSQVGPLVSQKACDSVRAHVDAAIEQGAVVVTDYERGLPGQQFFPPTVLDHVTPNMPVARDELFGPVVSVLRVSNVDEAIDVVNSSDYGLASVVFTTDLDVALRFARRAKSGMVHVNHGTISQPHVPFGGTGDSYVGDFSIGRTAKDFFTEEKVVYLKETAV